MENFNSLLKNSHTYTPDSEYHKYANKCSKLEHELFDTIVKPTEISYNLSYLFALNSKSEISEIYRDLAYMAINKNDYTEELNKEFIRELRESLEKFLLFSDEWGVTPNYSIIVCERLILVPNIMLLCDNAVEQIFDLTTLNKNLLINNPSNMYAYYLSIIIKSMFKFTDLYSLRYSLSVIECTNNYVFHQCVSEMVIEDLDKLELLNEIKFYKKYNLWKNINNNYFLYDMIDKNRLYKFEKLLSYTDFTKNIIKIENYEVLKDKCITNLQKIEKLIKSATDDNILKKYIQKQNGLNFEFSIIAQLTRINKSFWKFLIEYNEKIINDLYNNTKFNDNLCSNLYVTHFTAFQRYIEIYNYINDEMFNTTIQTENVKFIKKLIKYFIYRIFESIKNKNNTVENLNLFYYIFLNVKNKEKFIKSLPVYLLNREFEPLIFFLARLSISEVNNFDDVQNKYVNMINIFNFYKDNKKLFKISDKDKKLYFEILNAKNILFWITIDNPLIENSLQLYYFTSGILPQEHPDEHSEEQIADQPEDITKEESSESAGGGGGGKRKKKSKRSKRRSPGRQDCDNIVCDTSTDDIGLFGYTPKEEKIKEVIPKQIYNEYNIEYDILEYDVKRLRSNYENKIVSISREFPVHSDELPVGGRCPSTQIKYQNVDTMIDSMTSETLFGCYIDRKRRHSRYEQFNGELTESINQLESKIDKLINTINNNNDIKINFKEKIIQKLNILIDKIDELNRQNLESYRKHNVVIKKMYTKLRHLGYNKKEL